MNRLTFVTIVITALTAVVTLTSCNKESVNPKISEKEFIVTFETGWGDNAIVPQKVKEGGKVTKPEKTPTQEGYNFTGWYKEMECTNEWKFDMDLVSTNTILYARWIFDIHKLEPIDSGINIRMIEHSPQALQLNFSTKKMYPCCNFPIVFSWQLSSNIIDITFDGVFRSGICLTLPGPATAGIDLGVLNNETYQLYIHNGHETYTGELIVSSDNYKINFVDNLKVNCTNTPLNKIPENTILVTLLR